jgi:predicted ATPase
MITTVAVENDRSLRLLTLPLSRLTVITGANGSGKSSLYRALRLLAETASDGAVAALAREGGLPSTMWAGPEGGSRFKNGKAAPTHGTVRMIAALLTPRHQSSSSSMSRKPACTNCSFHHWRS